MTHVWKFVGQARFSDPKGDERSNCATLPVTVYATTNTGVMPTAASALRVAFPKAHKVQWVSMEQSVKVASIPSAWNAKDALAAGLTMFAERSHDLEAE